MTPNNMCPDCRKSYSHMPTRCVCGWYLTKEQVTTKTDRFACQFIKSDGSQCSDTGSPSFQTRTSDFFCWLHAQELREASFKR